MRVRCSGPMCPISAPSIYSGLDYLDEMQGVPVDRTPFPYNQGDPDRPADLSNDYSIQTAQAGHDWDQGAPAALRHVANPDIGKPVMQQYQVQSTEQQPVYSPNGQMVEVPGSREAPVLNWFNAAPVNVGIGYYVPGRRAASLPADRPGPRRI